jgi:hypothetical protein
MKLYFLCLFFCMGAISNSHAQRADTSKIIKANTAQSYFIINAGTTISAYFKDKPLSVESISKFNDYVQANAKILKDASVVVTGKPKTGTFDEVLKTLKRNRIKNITQNITKD